MSFQDPKVFPLKSCTIVEMDKFKRKSLFNMSVTSILYSTSSWTIRAPGTISFIQRNTIQAIGNKFFKPSKRPKLRNSSLVYFFKESDFNERPTILKHILNIHFTDLKELWLRSFSNIQDGNNILNIQALAFISMEKLECLSLSQNHITNADALAKCKFSELTHIYFETNKTLKLSKIHKCTFNKMFDFVLEYEKKDPVTFQDASSLAKINLFTKAAIRIKGRKRILQQKVYDSLNRGFDECTILIAPEILASGSMIY